MEKERDIAELKAAGLEIAIRLNEKGYKAYWVGGCVRNMILDIPPEDIDIATDAQPDEVSRLFDNTLMVGAKFGVVLVFINKVPVEVATFRADNEYRDHRHPQSVTFSSPQQDALRRDFTMNALFYDPINEKILDYVGGKKDIERRIVRAVGDAGERFKEDALRMLRAIRFAARFDFSIDAQTWRGIENNIDLINEISIDRIREELIKMFTNKGAGKSLGLLYESGLLVRIIPEVADMKGVPQPEQFHPEGDVFEHTALALDTLEKPSPELAFAVLLHDVGKPRTFSVEERIRFDSHDKVGAEIADRICRRLNFSNQSREYIVSLVSRHMMFLNVQQMRESRLRRFLGSPSFKDDLELHRIDCLASHRDLSNYEFCLQKIREFQEQEKEVLPPPLIDGNDLITAGYKPGPLFSEILDTVLDLQLEGKLNSKEAALNWVRDNFPLED